MSAIHASMILSDSLNSLKVLHHLGKTPMAKCELLSKDYTETSCARENGFFHEGEL